MGRVKERDAFTLERQRDAKLFGERVIASRFEHGAKVVAKRLDRGSIFQAAEQNELGVVIETRQLPQQVADVGADAEIVQLSRVDAMRTSTS